jgi:hypothetical protein
MRKFFSVMLLTLCVMTGALFGSTVHAQPAEPNGAEAFLTELFAIDGQAEEVPMEERAGYLQQRFGEYCEPEMLEELMSMRLPFSLMNQGFNLSVTETALEEKKPVNGEAGVKVNFRVTAGRATAGRAMASGEEVQTVEIVGRLTLNQETGRVQSIRVDNLEALLGDQPAEPNGAEAFLTELFAIDGQAEEVPMEERAGYLQQRFGEYCEPEMLEELMSMRLPFSLMNQGFDLSVTEAALEEKEPVNGEAGVKVNFRVTAGRATAGRVTASRASEEEAQTVEIVGRLTLNQETGRVQSIRVDNLEALLALAEAE